MQGLQKPLYKRTLSIASGGDNSLALLMRTTDELLAIDMHCEQLYLLELKAKLIGQVSRLEAIAFLGLAESRQRLKLYRQLRGGLTSEARAYWDAHESYIARGVLHFGKLDRYFSIFCRRIMPLIHSREKARFLLSPKPAVAQQQFYEQRWDTWRWKALFRVFFSQRTMSLLGRDPAKFAHIETSLADQLYHQSAQHLASVHAQGNGFLHYLLVGGFGEYLPWYLRDGNYDQIATNLPKLRLFHGSLAEVVASSFELFNLSNIFEYMDLPAVEANAKVLMTLATPGAEIFYWNMMVPRSLSEQMPKEFLSLEKLEEGRGDWGLFYQRFLREQIRA